MRLVELFAGSGGAALGLEAAGYSHIHCVERDQDACKTLRYAGFPAWEDSVENYCEFVKRGGPPEEPVDAVWASFPCQPFSSAGKRNINDKRNLWDETFKVTKEIRPRWFMGENVTGLLQHKAGCEKGCLGPGRCARAYFDRVIIHQLRSLYPFVAWRVLNSSDFGVPQHRRRVFIVAGPNRIHWPKPTHGRPTNQVDLFGRELLPWATVRQALKIENLQGITARQHSGSERPKDLDEPCLTLLSGGNGDNGFRLLLGGTRPEILDEPSATVTAYRDFKGSSPGNSPEKLRAACDGLFLSTGRRRLTTEECAILQGFDLGHLFWGNKRSVYRQIGNAVPPKLAEVVGLAVIEADADQTLDLVKGAGLVCSPGGC